MALSLADELAGAFSSGVEGDHLGLRQGAGSMSLAEEFGLDIDMDMNQDTLDPIESDDEHGEHVNMYERGPGDVLGEDDKQSQEQLERKGNQAITPPKGSRRLNSGGTARTRTGLRAAKANANAKASLSPRLHPDLAADSNDDLEPELEYQYQHHQGQSFDRPSTSPDQEDGEHEDHFYRIREESFDAVRVPDLEDEHELSSPVPDPSPLKMRNMRSKSSIRSTNLNLNLNPRASHRYLRGQSSVSDLKPSSLSQSQSSRYGYGYDHEIDQSNLSQGQEALIVLSEALGSSSRLLTSLKSLDSPIPPGSPISALQSDHSAAPVLASGTSQRVNLDGSRSDTVPMAIDARLHIHLERMLDCEKKREEMIRELNHMDDEAASKLGWSLGRTFSCSSSSDTRMDVGFLGQAELNGLRSLTEEDEEGEDGADDLERKDRTNRGWTGEIHFAGEEKGLLQDQSKKEEPADWREDRRTQTGTKHDDGCPDTATHSTRARRGTSALMQYENIDEDKDNHDNDQLDHDLDENDNDNDSTNRYENDDHHVYDRIENKEIEEAHARARDSRINDEDEAADEHIDPHDALMMDDDDDQDHGGGHSFSPSLLPPITPSASSSTALSGTSPAHANLLSRTRTQGDIAQNQNRIHQVPTPLLPHLTSALISDTASFLSILRQLSETLHTSSSLNTSIARQLKGIKSSLESARAREETVQQAKAGVEEWEAGKIRDGLRGESVQGRLGGEVDGFRVKLEEYERVLQGFSVARGGRQRTWIRIQS
ncbi:hypothetical protein I317_02475 [Kwoniella heveanensis CBS 569]|nr:hypothetical protein I317_02475 [Kwoniella heveanensis CBS 569]